MRPTIDSHLRGTVVVDGASFSVHEGLRFKASYLVPHGSELANDTAIDILLVTGAKHIHLMPRISAGGDCDLLAYAETAVSGSGTPIGGVSKNQEKSQASEVTVFLAPTVTDVGDLLLSWFLPGGTRLGDGASWSEAQWVLKANTNYLFRLTNRSGAGIQLSVSMGWMEK